jgi:hypothetical protein
MGGGEPHAETAQERERGETANLRSDGGAKSKRTQAQRRGAA